MAIKTIGINDLGFAVGQYHHNAKLSDDEVALIFELMEEADNRKLCGLDYMSDKTIAEKFEVTKGCISHYRHGNRRSQSPVRYITAEEVGYKLRDGEI